MKKLVSYFVFFVLIFLGKTSTFAQVTLYSTDFGITQTLPTGWSISTTGFPPDLSISAGTPSDCGTCSNGDNMLMSAQDFGGGTQTLLLSGQVSTIGYTAIQVAWTARMTLSFPSSLRLEYSTDGVTFTSVSFVNVSGNSTWASVAVVDVDATTEAENIADLQFRFVYASNGSFDEYRIDDFTITGVVASSGVFYNIAGQDLTLLSSWGTNIDGSGVNPIDFTSASQEFHVANGGTATVSTPWTVSGTSSKIVVEKATTLTASTAITATIDVANQGHLTINNTTYPTFGVLSTGSTVEYAAGTSITSTTYSNLTISAASMNMVANITCDSLTLNQTFSINGNILTINGLLSGTGALTGSNTSSVVVSGVGNFGTLTISNAALENLTINRAGVDIILGYHLIVGGATAGTGAVTLINGRLLINGYILRFTNSDLVISGGSLVGSAMSQLQINGAGAFTGVALDQTDIASSSLAVLDNGRTTVPVLVNSALNIISSLASRTGAILDLNGQDITLDDAQFISDGVFRGNSANITIQGVGGTAAGTLTFDQTTKADRTINNITMNRAGALAVLTLGAATRMEGEINIVAGTFDFNNQAVDLGSSGTGTAKLLAVTGTLFNGSTLTVERYIGGSAGWRMLAAPGSGALLSDWNVEIGMSGFPNSNDPTSSFVSTYFYNETANAGTSANGYQAPTDVSNVLPYFTTGAGVFTYLSSTGNTPIPMVANITANHTTGTKTITDMSLTGAAGAETGWHAIGNPYPCELRWAEVIANGMLGIGNSGAIYTVDANQNFTASTAAVLASCEGGFVQVTNATNTITFQENDKSLTGQADTYNDKLLSTGIPSLTFQIEVGGHTDKSYLKFNANATASFEHAYDARKMDNMAGKTNIAVVSSGNESLEWNTISETGANNIPLKVYRSIPLNATEVYTLTISNVTQLLQHNKCLTFEDTYAGVSFPLTGDTTYTFTMMDTTSTPRLFINVSSPLTENSTNVSCNAVNDGSATVFGAGSSVTYTWTDQAGNVMPSVIGNLNNLSAGYYHVTVNGISGTCSSATTSFEILDAAPINANAIVTNVACNGVNTGSISLSPLGGDGSVYSYNWNTGSSSSTVSNLNAGNYMVTINDNMGCETIETINITENDPILVSSLSTDASCFASNDGSINLEVNSASSFAFSYLWSNGETTQNISNLPAGQYDVTITDEFGCNVTSSTSIQEPLVIEALFSTSKDTLTLNEGAIVAFTNNSIGTNEFYWDFGDGTTSIDVSPWHEYTTGGSFNVSLVAGTANCSATINSTIVVNVINSISTNDINEDVKFVQMDGKLYGYFNSPNQSTVQVSIYNSIGQEVRGNTQNMVGNIIEIDLPTTTGVYIIKLQYEGKQYVKKHIIADI